ncbi:UPF0643 protein [Mycena chlorophos]|uniref:UPF0643 protein n=1 Tax=Mycena chlorophos TaxID=658473 RepID=A0A8H6RXD4_MYCCL|nr:UPF0643 protein [Mycena chlorophos]
MSLPRPAKNDPHALPSFTVARREPVLYLPPLISGLPERLPPVVLPDNQPPVVTETRLPDIDPCSLSLHKALHNFKPLDSEYAATPYEEAFNWDEFQLPIDEAREWYCVVFRSRRRAGSDSQALYDADKKAHEEAVRNGGLLLYWFGVPAPGTGLNLATCIWQSRKHAIAANARPHHVTAMRLAMHSYEVYDLERYVLRKSAGSTGVVIEPFSGGDVGW